MLLPEYCITVNEYDAKKGSSSAPSSSTNSMASPLNSTAPDVLASCAVARTRNTPEVSAELEIPWIRELDESSIYFLEDVPFD